MMMNGYQILSLCVGIVLSVLGGVAIGWHRRVREETPPWVLAMGVVAGWFIAWAVNPV
jgi:hypothetical protein